MAEQDLYFIEQFSKDENGDLVPMVIAVRAKDEDDARVLLMDSFVDMRPNVNLGEVRKASKTKYGYIFTRGQAKGN